MPSAVLSIQVVVQGLAQAAAAIRAFDQSMKRSSFAARTFLGALTAIATAGPGILALSGALFAVGSALGPLVGLGAAAAVGMTAFAQALGTVALAAMGVGDALKEQLQNTGKINKAAISSADQQRQAARAIANAQEGVRNAQRGVRDATDALAEAERNRTQVLAALGPAQQQARRDLQDMHASLRRAALDERSAVMALQSARDQLAYAMGPAVADRLAQAQETLTRTTRNEQGAVRDLASARQRLADLMKPPDALTLADAQDAVADASRNETRAALRLADARKNLEKVQKDPASTAHDIAAAKLELADAENAVGDASRDSAKAQQALADIQAGPDPSKVAEAKQNVADAEQAVADAARDTAKAQQELADAQQGPDPKEIAKLKHEVAQAEQDLADATRERARLERDVAKAEKDGVNGAAGVVAAREQIRDADRQVAEAEERLAEAHRDVARAQRAVRDAQASAESGMARAAQAAVDLNEKFNKLPPAAQAFVRELVAMKPRFDELRSTAASGLFPGVIDGLRAAQGAFGAVNETTSKTANVLGDLARRAGELVGSSGFAKDLATIGDRNALIIDRVGRAAIYLGDAFRHLLVAAGPLTTWLAKVTLKWAENVAETAKAGRESGRMADFFQKVRNTAIRVASIIGGLTGALFEMGKVSAPFGRDMLESMDRAMERFEAWTKSAEGHNSLAEFFRMSRDFAEQLMPVLGRVLEAFGQYSKTVLPAFTAVLETIEPIIGPLVQAFLYWRLVMIPLTAIMTVFNAVLAANPIGLVVIALAALVAGFVLAYKKSETFRNVVNGVWESIKTVAKPVIDWLAKAGVEVWDAIKNAASTAIELIGGWINEHRDDIRAFGKAWGNIAKGIAAAAEFYIEKIWLPVMSRAFEVVKAVWPGIKMVIEGALQAIGGVIDLFSGIFTGDFGRMWDGVKAIFKGVGKALAGLTRAAFDMVLTVIKEFGPLLLAAGKWVVGMLIDGVKALPGLIGDVASWIWGNLDDGIKALAGAYGSAGTWVLGRIVDGVKAIPGVVKDVGKWLKDRAFEGVKNSIEGWKLIGKWALETLIKGWKAFGDIAKSVGGWLKNRAKEGVEDSIEGWKLIGKWALNRVVDGFKTVTELLGSVGGWLKNRAKEFIELEVDGFKKIGSWIVNRVVDGFKTVTEALGSVGGWLKNRFVDLIEKGEGIKDAFLGIGERLIGWIVDGIKAGVKTGMAAIAKFALAILNVVDKIPGVDMSGPRDAIKEFGKSNDLPGFARGGAYARTGGVVNSPITLMGEEAPRHPEFVIPTNPAYRGRARQLAMMAAQAVGLQGLAKGGQFKSTAYGPPWGGIQGTGVTATGIDLRPAKQEYGVAVDPAVIELGSMLKINPNPFGTDEKFKAFDTGGAIKGNRIDFYDWRGRESQNAWGTRFVNVVQGSGSFLSDAADFVSGAVGGAFDLLKDGAKLLLGKLPGVGDLPDWLKGLGREVLGKVGSWIKDKALGLLGDGGDGGVTPVLKGGRLQLPASFKSTHDTGGLPGYPAVDIFGPPGQGVLSPAAGTISRLSGSAGGPGGGGAYGYSMYLKSALGEYFLTHFGSRAVKAGAKVKRGDLLGTIADYPDRADHIHMGFRKFAQGGVWGGLLDSYHDGTPFVPRTGPYLLHRGERVVDAATNARGMDIRVIVEDHTTRVEVNGREVDARIERKLAQRDRDLNAGWNASVGPY